MHDGFASKTDLKSPKCICELFSSRESCATKQAGPLNTGEPLIVNLLDASSSTHDYYSIV